MATCRELPEEEEGGWFCFKPLTKLFFQLIFCAQNRKKAWQKDQVYNQLEIYNYDVENDVWSGPDVYFSSPRSHGTDHTKPFDSFWLDSLKFKVMGGVSPDSKKLFRVIRVLTTTAISVLALQVRNVDNHGITTFKPQSQNAVLRKTVVLSMFQVRFYTINISKHEIE